MNPELDQVCRHLDEALIAFSAGRCEEAYFRIHKAAITLQILGTALQVAEPEAHCEDGMALMKAA